MSGETSFRSEILIRATHPVPRPIEALRELWRHRELIWSLAEREIRVRYKQTMLGAAWAVLTPFSMMVMFTVVFSHFARMPSEGLPYAIFSYTAAVPWAFFSGAVTSAAMSLVNQGALIRKAFFPKEVLPLATILSHALDFAIALGMCGILMAVYHVPFTLQILSILPLIAVQVLFTGGVAFFLSALAAYFRDVRAVLPLGMQVWLYATPVVFPLGLVPERWRTFYVLINPMASLIDGYRRALAKGTSPQWSYVGLAALASLVVLWCGYRFFKILERRVAEVV